MKKQLSIPVLTAFVILLSVTSACKKYTCECTAYNLNTPESLGQSHYTVSGTKEKRKTQCNEKSTSPDLNGNYTTCMIK